MAKKVQ